MKEFDRRIFSNYMDLLYEILWPGETKRLFCHGDRKVYGEKVT